jgi:hypothetical protein
MQHVAPHISTPVEQLFLCSISGHIIAEYAYLCRSLRRARSDLWWKKQRVQSCALVCGQQQSSGQQLVNTSF